MSRVCVCVKNIGARARVGVKSNSRRYIALFKYRRNIIINSYHAFKIPSIIRRHRITMNIIKIRVISISLKSVWNLFDYTSSYTHDDANNATDKIYVCHS